jgi:hypothetical protein
MPPKPGLGGIFSLPEKAKRRSGNQSCCRCALNSVQTLELTLLTLKLLEMTLNGGSCFTLTNSGRLLVVLTTTYFRQYTGLLAGTLEATQCYIKRLILFHFNSWHSKITYLIDSVSIGSAGLGHAGSIPGQIG